MSLSASGNGRGFISQLEAARYHLPLHPHISIPREKGAFDDF
jgi:hypothetical protein